MSIRLKLLLFFFFLAFSSRGLDGDSTLYRQPSSELLEELESNSSYDYNIGPVRGEGESWLDRLRREIGYLLRRFWYGAVSNVWSRTLLIVLGAVALLYILYRILGPDRIGLATNRKRNLDTSKMVMEEIPEESLYQLLEKAERNKDWREYIHLQFHLLLRKLEASGHLKISPLKTSVDYRYEIKSETLAQQFAQLGRTFEYVWYGGFEADESRAQQYRQDCKKLGGLWEELVPI